MVAVFLDSWVEGDIVAVFLEYWVGGDIVAVFCKSWLDLEGGEDTLSQFLENIHHSDLVVGLWWIKAFFTVS